MDFGLTYGPPKNVPCCRHVLIRSRFRGPVLTRSNGSKKWRAKSNNRRGNYCATNGPLGASVCGCFRIHSNRFGGFCAGQRSVQKRMIYVKSSRGDFSDLDFDSVSDPDNPDFDEIKLDEDFYKSMGMTKEEAERSQQFRAEDVDPEAGRFSLDDVASLAPDIPDYVKEGLSKGVMFGPPAILVAGFLLEELPMVRYVVDAAGGQAVKVIPVTNEMLHKNVEEVVEFPEPDWEKPRPDDFMGGGGWGAQRAIVFGGMKVEAQAAVIELLEEGGLPAICPMAATEETKRMKLGELLADAVKYQRFRKNPENDLWKVGERAAKDLPDVENYLQDSIKNRVKNFEEGMESGMMDLEEDEDGILQVKFKKEVVDRHNRGRKTPQQKYEDAVKDWGPEMTEDELRDKYGGMDAEQMKKMVEELSDGEAFERWIKQQEAEEEKTSARNGSPDLGNGVASEFNPGNEQEEGYPEDWEVLESLKQVQEERMASERDSKSGDGGVESSDTGGEHVDSEAVESRGAKEGEGVSKGFMEGLNKGWMDSGSLELEEEVPVGLELEDAVGEGPESVDDMAKDSSMEADVAYTESTEQEIEKESAASSASFEGAPEIATDPQPVENDTTEDPTDENTGESGQTSAAQQPPLDDGVYEGDFFAIDNLVGDTLGLNPLKRPEPEPQMTMQEMLELPLGQVGSATEPRESKARPEALDGDETKPAPAEKDSVGGENPSKFENPVEKEEIDPIQTEANFSGEVPSEKDSSLEVVEADQIISGGSSQETDAEPSEPSRLRVLGKSQVPANTLEEFKEYMKDQENEIEYNPDEHGHIFEPPMERASQFAEFDSKSSRREDIDKGKKESVEAALRDAVENGVDPEELKRMIDGLAKKQKSPEARKSEGPQGFGSRVRKPTQRLFRSRFSYKDEPPRETFGRKSSITSPADIIPIDDQDLEVVEGKLVTQGDWDSVFGRPFYEKPPVQEIVPEEVTTERVRSEVVEDVKSSPGADASPNTGATLTRAELAEVAERQGLNLDDLLADARERGINISD